MPNVQVGAADASSLNGDLDFALSWFWFWNVSQPDESVTCLILDNRFHYPLLECAMLVLGMMTAM